MTDNPLKVSETVILTNFDLDPQDVAEINAFIGKIGRTRAFNGPTIIGVFNTEREFDMDFRPTTLIARYPKEK